MIDRDPITEPAGELVAARTFADLLLWLDGDTNAERYDQVAERLLNWKGKRLRDVLHEQATLLLTQRLEALQPDTPDLLLRRITAAAGLVLQPPELEIFARRWLGLAPEDTAFRLRRLRALDDLFVILPQRRERDLADTARLLLHHRAVLAVDPPGPDGAPPHVHPDALLADHLYQHLGRHEPLAAELRRWFIRNAEHPWAGRLRVLRTAVLLGHLDVIRALFDAAAHAPLTANTPPGLADAAVKLILDRLAEVHPELLLDLAMALATPLHRDPQLTEEAARWLLDLQRRAAARHGGAPAVAALRTFAQRAPDRIDLQALAPEAALQLRNLLQPLPPS